MQKKIEKINKKNSPNFEREDFCKLAGNIIKDAKKLGATAVEFDACIGSGFSTVVHKGDVETVEHSNGKTIGVTVYFGSRTGSAITSDLKSGSINLMLEKACYIARYTSEDPFVGLAEPELMAHNYPDLDLYHPWSISISDAIEIAKHCESLGFKHDPRIKNSDGAALSTNESFNVYANSHGFCGTTARTRHSVSCSFIAEENGEMQRDDNYTVARDPNDLENFDKVAIKAAEKTISRLGAKRISTRECPVIFIAEVAGSLINLLVSAICGGNLYRKASFLLDHIDKQVLAKNINIEEKPLLPKGLGSASFDCEGVKLFNNELVVDGILKRYVLDSYSARKLKTKTTGNAGGIHNLIVKTDAFGFDELIRKMGSGLIITEFMGDGVNIITGDYSRGVFGYWVENGKIAYPVTGATVAGNLRDMLLNISAISNDTDRRSAILTGSILINKMIIAGS